MSLRVRSGLFVLVFAGLVRLPHHDISWFGNDQINFVAEARRVLSGDWNIVGPLAAGLNIVGPLYSYLLAGLLWIGKDAAFVTLVNALCEVVAAWLVYDTARRLSGNAAGVVAGVLYASAPVLVISNRLIWNPSLVPAAIALGCWLVVRYTERPTTGRLLVVALVCGLTPTLHATGIFVVAGWVIVLLSTRPTLRQLAVAAVVAALPQTPLLVRMLGNSSSGRSLAQSFAANDVLATLEGIRAMMLRFPIGALGDDWSAAPSAIVLHLDALVAVIGLAIGVARRGRYRAVWMGLSAALFLHLAGSIVYSGHLAWYYFTSLAPIGCLCVGHAVEAWRPWRIPAAALIALLALTHVVFVYHFDRRAIEMGLIRFPADGRLTLRFPTGGPTHGITVREVEQVSVALANTFSDGVTAMRASHGARGELWREAGAEPMPRVPIPPVTWGREFVLMGREPLVLDQSARLVGARVCSFDRPRASWRDWPGEVPAGWDLPEFPDGRWYELDIPRRMMAPLSAGPAVPGLWRNPRQSFRGRVPIEDPSRPRLYAVVLHSHGYSQHWITRFSVNGIEVGPAKSRVIPSSVFRNEEWLFDVTKQLRQGQNLIAVAVDGTTQAFDVDIFEVPCLDREWYNVDSDVNLASRHD
jgi:hypothetical protein